MFSALVVGAFAGVVVRPMVGVGVGLAVALAMRFATVRTLLRLLPPAAIGVAGLYIAYRQARHHLPPIFEWPTFFGRIRTLGWIAVAALAASAVVELVLERRRDGPSSG